MVRAQDGRAQDAFKVDESGGKGQHGSTFRALLLSSMFTMSLPFELQVPGSMLSLRNITVFSESK